MRRGRARRIDYHRLCSHGNVCSTGTRRRHLPPPEPKMSTVAVIPVKQLKNAKQRLGALLGADDRRELFRAMVSDVLDVATTCDLIDKVIVVTSDDEVAAIAREFGAEVRPEPAETGLIAAVQHTAQALSAEGVERMVFLPADVPLATVEELEVVLDGEITTLMIVPARDLGGSNCVVCSPPDCIEFGFGEDSFRRHLRIARSAGIEAAVAKLPGIGLDIDTPDDLADAIVRMRDGGVASNTWRFLVERGIGDARGASSPALGTTV